MRTAHTRQSRLKRHLLPNRSLKRIQVFFFVCVCVLMAGAEQEGEREKKKSFFNPKAKEECAGNFFLKPFGDYTWYIYNVCNIF